MRTRPIKKIGMGHRAWSHNVTVAIRVRVGVISQFEKNPILAVIARRISDAGTLRCLIRL